MIYIYRTYNEETERMDGKRSHVTFKRIHVPVVHLRMRVRDRLVDILHVK